MKVYVSTASAILALVSASGAFIAVTGGSFFMGACLLFIMCLFLLVAMIASE